MRKEGKSKFSVVEIVSWKVKHKILKNTEEPPVGCPPFGDKRQPKNNFSLHYYFKYLQLQVVI